MRKGDGSGAGEEKVCAKADEEDVENTQGRSRRGEVVQSFRAEALQALQPQQVDALAGGAGVPEKDVPDGQYVDFPVFEHDLHRLP